MATRRLSIAQGKTSKDITEAAGAAVVTASMEFTWDRAQSLRKDDLIRGLVQFIEYIKAHKAIPL